MAHPLDPKDLVTLEKLALSNMWETETLVQQRGTIAKRNK